LISPGTAKTGEVPRIMVRITTITTQQQRLAMFLSPFWCEMTEKSQQFMKICVAAYQSSTEYRRMSLVDEVVRGCRNLLLKVRKYYNDNLLFLLHKFVKMSTGKHIDLNWTDGNRGREGR
jgi:hypothetical protein